MSHTRPVPLAVIFLCVLHDCACSAIGAYSTAWKICCIAFIPSPDLQSLHPFPKRDTRSSGLRLAFQAARYMPAVCQATLSCVLSLVLFGARKGPLKPTDHRSSLVLSPKPPSSALPWPPHPYSSHDCDRRPRFIPRLRSGCLAGWPADLAVPKLTQSVAEKIARSFVPKSDSQSIGF